MAIGMHAHIRNIKFPKTLSSKRLSTDGSPSFGKGTVDWKDRDVCFQGLLEVSLVHAVLWWKKASIVGSTPGNKSIASGSIFLWSSIKYWTLRFSKHSVENLLSTGPRRHHLPRTLEFSACLVTSLYLDLSIISAYPLYNIILRADQCTFETPRFRNWKNRYPRCIGTAKLRSESRTPFGVPVHSADRRWQGNRECRLQPNFCILVIGSMLCQTQQHVASDSFNGKVGDWTDAYIINRTYEHCVDHHGEGESGPDDPKVEVWQMLVVVVDEALLVLAIFCFRFGNLNERRD